MGKRVRFITLTLPVINGCLDGYQSNLYGNGEIKLNIKDNFEFLGILWRQLYKRLREWTPMMLFTNGFIGISDLEKYYDINKWDDKFNFDYFIVKTTEGNGVIHIVTNIDYLPRDFLSELWLEIAGSERVWVNDPYKTIYGHKRNRNEKDVSNYLMSQYIGKQDDYIYSYSQNWIYKGWSKDFKEIKDECRDYDKPPICEFYGYFVFNVRWNDVYDKFYDLLLEKSKEKDKKIIQIKKPKLKIGFKDIKEQMNYFKKNEYRYLGVY